MKKLFLLLIVFLFSAGSAYSQRIVLSQGFENGPLTPDGLPLKWAKVKVNGSSVCADPIADWRIRDSGTVFCSTNTLYSFTAKGFGGTRKSLSIPWTTTSSSISDDWVFTDSMRIQTGDSLIFWCQLGTWPGPGTYYIDSLQIWVTGGQTPGTQLTKLGTVRSLDSANNFWQKFTFPLSAFAGQKVHLAFRYNMNLAYDGIMVNVDSVMVRNMAGIPVGVENNNSLIPKTFDLKQNYPNPFNPSTSIAYDLPRNEYVNITVYNSVGKEVAVLVDEVKTAGSYQINFDASGLPSGIYIYRIKAGDYIKALKMNLIK